MQEQITKNNQQPETLEINEFMLKMIEVLNRRFGAVNHQINKLSERISYLETEVTNLKNSLKPPETKVNKNILKHLE